MDIQRLLTCARDWQRIKQAYALEHAGTQDADQALVDSQRYHELIDAVEQLDAVLRQTIRIHWADGEAFDPDQEVDRLYRMVMAQRGQNCESKIGHGDEVERLRAVLESVADLASWHSDDEADPENQSPEDMVAHINGLIRMACKHALS